jgi:SAM-dependent methyltransferase
VPPRRRLYVFFEPAVEEVNSHYTLREETRMKRTQVSDEREWLTQGRRSDDPPAALERLVAACDRLEALAEENSIAGIRKFHRVVSLIHDICEALADAEASGVDPELLRNTVATARDIHARSPFITRLQQWPRGYPGDFETIEWLWRGENRAPAGSLGFAFEAYALSAAIAQQHRNKVALQAACMRQGMYADPSCRILSIGCGSSPDVRSVIDHASAGARFTLCDSDPDALEYSRAALGSAAERCQFVAGFVPRVLRRVRSEGPFNVILAGGLFDYLSDRFIQRTLHDAWHELLAPGGLMLFTNIARGNPFRVWLEYLANWRLIERSEQDVMRLCRDAGVPVEPALARDATGLAIVATIRKG